MKINNEDRCDYCRNNSCRTKPICSLKNCRCAMCNSRFESLPPVVSYEEGKRNHATIPFSPMQQYTADSLSPTGDDRPEPDKTY